MFISKQIFFFFLTKIILQIFNVGLVKLTYFTEYLIFLLTLQKKKSKLDIFEIKNKKKRKNLTLFFKIISFINFKLRINL